jgi:hypothetical protein
MINHYAIIKGEYIKGEFHLSIDHYLQHEKFNGVALDNISGKWIKVWNMSERLRERDALFTEIVSKRLHLMD